MGTVWLASDGLLARDVAIKETVRPPQLDDADWAVLQERSLREARTAARLHHPNIVGVFDVLEYDGRPWLVMQLVPYPSLRDVVAEPGPLWPAQAAHVGLRVLAAIRAAHDDGVLHRDVKPANVLLGPDDQIYFTDFGLAVAGSRSVTVAGIIMGSPGLWLPSGHERSPLPRRRICGRWARRSTRRSRAATRSSGTARWPSSPRSWQTSPMTRSAPDAVAGGGLLRKDPAARLGADETEYLLRRICEDAGNSGSARQRGRRSRGAGQPPRPRSHALRATHGAATHGVRRLCQRQRLPRIAAAAGATAAAAGPGAAEARAAETSAVKSRAAATRAANAATANARAGAPGAFANATPAAGFGAVSDGWSRSDLPPRRRPARASRSQPRLAIAAGLAVAAVVALTGNNSGHTAVLPVRASGTASTASQRGDHGHVSQAAPSSPATRPGAAVSHKPPRHPTSPAPQPSGTTPPAQTSPAPSPTPSAPTSSPPVSATPTPPAGTTPSAAASAGSAPPGLPTR